MSVDKNNEVGKTEAPNARWWESYLVRYLLGSIFGTLCVILLSAEFDLFRIAGNYSFDIFREVSHGAKSLAESDGTSASEGSHAEGIGLALPIALLGLLGLGYCYIVSSPITVLHAARYGRGTIDAHSRVVWLGWALALVMGQFVYKWLEQGGGSCLFLVGVIDFLVCFSLYLVFRSADFENTKDPSADFEKTKDPYKPSLRFGRGSSIEIKGFYLWSQTVVAAIGICVISAALLSYFEKKNARILFQYFIFGFPVIWIGAMQYAVLIRLWKEEGAVNEFYRLLFAARRMESAKDVRDTYTHLREHANSVFILMTELCVASLLIGVHRAAVVDNSEISGEGVGLWVLCGLGLWLLPTVFIWSRANSMERYFAEDPNVFLTKSEPLRAHACKERIAETINQIPGESISQQPPA